MKSASIYLHLPFCRKKCLYCDFFSAGASIADWEGYVDALLGELWVRINELPKECNIESVYLGGGTPSMMPAMAFIRLMEEIRRILALHTISISENTEITIEANPEDVNQEITEKWLTAGINRVSLGVQTFNDTLLNKIGRSHNSQRALAAIEELTKKFNNVSADIIFGLPGESMEILSNDLKIITSLPLQHISVYSLMYEEGTAMTALRDNGRITPLDDDICSEMYEEISRYLADKGFEQYEISNYSLSGYRSRHNSGYWSGRAYLGLGVAAHSFDGYSVRRRNPLNIKGYISRFKDSNPITTPTTEADVIESGDYRRNTSMIKSPFYIEERLTEEERIEERVMLSLRTREGIDLDKFRQDFGGEAFKHLMENAESMLYTDISKSNESIKETSSPLLKLDDNRLYLTMKGVMLSDMVILRLIS